MVYDNEFWSEHAKQNKQVNLEFTNFIKDLAISLKANSILEIGCFTGNDLHAFSENFQVYGIDLNDDALDLAIKKYPKFNIKKAPAEKLPFEDSTMDFVFTHKLFNYLDEGEIESIMNEMFRVSRKYILNCEIMNITNTQDKIKAIDMKERWKNFSVKIISNVEFHEEIDPEKSRFVLVRKL